MGTMNPQFFTKYASAHTEYDALKLMHNKMHDAKDKCKAGDQTFLHELAVLTEMLHDFWEAKGMDHKAAL